MEIKLLATKGIAKLSRFQTARVFFLLLLFAVLPATAQAATPAPAKSTPPASVNFDQEWSKLVAAAQQEGTLAIASGGAPSRQYRPVVDAFTKKFGIKVEVSTGNATDTVNRVLAERKPCAA